MRKSSKTCRIRMPRGVLRRVLRFYVSNLARRLLAFWGKFVFCLKAPFWAEIIVSVEGRRL
ncbi:MAG: hypothetical protein DBX55_09120 [Verrucomicrobia bacterium]|nr:MAG: hypothetical protein DBX55_09120 [Verrucomicrobiota bacterium]